MSRKSARLRTKKLDGDEEAPAPSTSGSRKRKAEEPLEHTMEPSNKRKQFNQIQANNAPASRQSTAETIVIPDDSPHKDASDVPASLPSPRTTPGRKNSPFRFPGHFLNSCNVLRNSPLPELNWADPAEVWEVMLKKEQQYTRSHCMLDRHSGLQPRMRAILLDWLIEVCEVYRLHRETFNLAVDFIDRYLSMSRNIHKQQLQLIGITCLFIAAKIEEIYPPKLTEFAYVTDGACRESEILDKELIILKALKWDLCPLTPNAWLNVYLQLVNLEHKENTESNFVYPQYSPNAFVQIARLLDLCQLDIGCLQFPYSVLATSAMYHMSSQHVALSVSGYKWLDIASCVQWMSAFAMTLREVGPVELKFYSQVSRDDTHNIQTHAVDLTLLENAQARIQQITQSSRSSPDLKEYPGLVTPPQSKGKNTSRRESTT